MHLLFQGNDSPISTVQPNTSDEDEAYEDYEFNSSFLFLYIMRYDVCAYAFFRLEFFNGS